MKRYFSAILAALLTLAFCACAPAGPVVPQPVPEETITTKTTEPATTEDVTEADTTEPTVPETTEAETTEPTEAPVLLPLPEGTMEFIFSSGAGAWRTLLTLYADGTFTGYFQDSDMGVTDDAYPNGTAYICSFSGSFENITQVDAYTYSMTLGQLTTEHTPGEEWIEDGIRYVASGPYGLEGGSHFLFCLPDTPVSILGEEMRYWWPYRFEQDNALRQTVSCYGLLNMDTSDGFFSE